MARCYRLPGGPSALRRRLKRPKPRIRTTCVAAMFCTLPDVPISVFGRRSKPASIEQPPGVISPSSAETAGIQRLIDAIDALVVIASPDGCLWMWNQRCDATSGIPLGEVAGKSLWSVMRLRPNLRARAQESFDRVIAGVDRSVEFKAQWARKDGRKALVSWTARLVEIGAGHRYVVATGTETTRGHRLFRQMAATGSPPRAAPSSSIASSEWSRQGAPSRLRWSGT